MSERIHSQLNVIKEKEANVNKNKDMSMDKNMSKGKMSEIKLDMIKCYTKWECTLEERSCYQRWR